MDKKEVLNKVQQLQNKALILGMDWEADQSPLFAENHLSDFISEVVDGTDEIMNLFKGEKHD